MGLVLLFRWCDRSTAAIWLVKQWVLGQLQYSFFLPQLFMRIELLWQEGLLLDFLQKTTCDSWMRKFLIFASYLFNERWLFDKVIRFFLDFIIWPLHHINIFDTLNIMWLLIILIGGFGLLFNLWIVIYILLQ